MKRGRANKKIRTFFEESEIKPKQEQKTKKRVMLAKTRTHKPKTKRNFQY